MTGSSSTLRLFAVLLFHTVSCLGGTPVQRVLSSPPDECVDNQVTRKVLGHDWREPIYNGYVFVSNRYVDAPYVFEQRGGAIYVNGLRFDYIPEDQYVYDVAQTLARQPPPANLASTATVQDIVLNDNVRAHAKHLVATLADGDEAILRFCDYLRTLPAITNVLDSGMDSDIGQRDILLTDRSGKTGTFVLSYDFSDVHFSPRHSTFPDHFGTILEILRTDGCVISQRGCIAICWFGSSVEATNLLLTLTADDLTPTQRLSTMEEMAFVDGPNKATFGILYPLQGVIVTDQFRQRFRGDTTWTNDGPARLLRLTNGWVKVKPYARPVDELAKRLAESRARRELLEEEQHAAQLRARELAFAEEQRQRLIKRTGRTIQDSLSAALAKATNAPREYVLPDICHWTLDQTNHIYSIGDCSGGNFDCLTPEWARPGHPGAIQEIEFARTNLSLLVRSNGPLTNLQAFVDSLAFRGYLPCWRELEMRRLRSPHFNSNLFTEIPVRTAVAWNWRDLWPVALTNDGGQVTIFCRDRVPGVTNGVSVAECQLSITGGVGLVSVCTEKAIIQRDNLNKLRQMSHRNTVTVDNKTLMVVDSLFKGMGCGYENYMTVRVFDGSGKYVWQLPNFLGSVTVLCGDVTNDGLDDIVIQAIDHGAVSHHVFKQQPEQ